MNDKKGKSAKKDSSSSKYLEKLFKEQAVSCTRGSSKHGNKFRIGL
ncbi:hypothetical protein LEP1GSC133_2981 [Leptospira borgpetersenii serovar Pomona str. 200901868]|uniref:Uncharacterized protein n=1 Tax=Leptospira borgpetersenii serovar Pomona str. 200901868 TaxID=1192866 RepID=M6WBD3_LEPBO|nr:hypothetical protein LEP1GSC133_2981 [Leptospira borgpetersenii serovar Pomona str. 200901868]